MVSVEELVATLGPPARVGRCPPRATALRFGAARFGPRRAVVGRAARAATGLAVPRWSVTRRNAFDVDLLSSLEAWPGGTVPVAGGEASGGSGPFSCGAEAGGLAGALGCAAGGCFGAVSTGLGGAATGGAGTLGGGVMLEVSGTGGTTA